MKVPSTFTPGSKPKKGLYLLDQCHGRRVPSIFTHVSKPKKGIHLRSRLRRGVPLLFTTGSKPKKVYTPNFQSRVKHKKGITFIPFFGFNPGVKVGGTPQSKPSSYL